MAGDPPRRFCCDADLEQIGYDGQHAAEDLEAYRNRGPSPATAELIEVLRQEGVREGRVLDIGAGIGAVHLALLESGAASAIDVDASQEYLDVARAEAERRGLAERVSYRYGDVVELADELPPVDVVALDSVICCYPNLERLLRAAVRPRPRLVGLTFPHDGWWMRTGMRLFNAYGRLAQRPDRYWIHRPSAIDAIMREAGYARTHQGGTRTWRVLVYRAARNHLDR